MAQTETARLDTTDATPRLHQAEDTGPPPQVLGGAEQMGRAEKMRILGEMASGIVHDFNNLLGAILGRAQMVQVKDDVEEIRRQVAQIEKIALQGAETVKRLHDFLRQGRPGEFAPTDLATVVGDALEVTRHRWEAQAQQRGVIYTIATQFDQSAVVSGVHAELVDAVANLILNAIDAMPEGGPVSCETSCRGERCRLVVADEGVGMTPEQTERVFSPFYTTKGSKGTGLGLAVVHGIVNHHGGTVHVESAVGQGSRFIIELPAANCPLAAVTAAPPAADARPRGRRVLLVDDDLTILDVIGEALREVGHEVDAKDNGAAALAALVDSNYDVVVTDLGMPGVTGWEVAKFARDRTPHVPVIIISGWGAQIEQRQLNEYGVAALLAKPFGLEQIRDAIAKAVVSAD